MKLPPSTTTTITTSSSCATSLTSITAAITSGDVRSIGYLIQRCSDHNLFNLGRQLHARLILSSIVPSNFLACKLIAFYSRSHHLAAARHLFDKIPLKNLFACNAMLIAYSQHSTQPSQSLEFFSTSFPSHIKPDAFTLSALLKSVSCSFSCREIHGFAARNGFLEFDSDIFVANGLVGAYARNGFLCYARKVFDRTRRRDIVSWNSIISGYSQAGLYGECLKMYFEMDGVRPDKVTVISVLHACAQTKDLATGMRVHQFLMENNNKIEMDVSVWNSAIGFYAKCGSLDYARSLFDTMPDRDAVSYNSMITGYMAYGFVEKAKELFNQMEDQVISTWNSVIAGLVQNNRYSNVFDLVRAMQGLGFRPNSVTLSSVLPAISFYSNLYIGKQVHCYAIRNDCDQNIYVETALIDIYAKAGYLAGARCIFDGTRNRSVIIWTSIISAYSSHGYADEAIWLFNTMLQSGTDPDPVTFTSVLSACAHGGALKEARQIFDTMANFNIVPSVEHYACMVGVLTRYGLLKEAVEFICKMPVEPNAKIWGALLNGAAIFNDVELGSFAFEKLVEIELENTGNYVIMANLYSGAGKWDKADKVREKMKGVGLAKIPGCSWIETSNGLQVFVARDSLNERSDEIYTALEGLVVLMRDEGYVFHEEFDEESCR